MMYVLSVLWNHRDRLPDLFSSLKNQSRPADQVFCLDDASADGSANWIREQTQAVCLRLMMRQGSARGYNQLIRLVLNKKPEELEKTILLFLSPDTLLAADALEKIEQAFIDRPELMMVTPWVFRAEHRPIEGEDGFVLVPSEAVDHAGGYLTKSGALLPITRSPDGPLLQEVFTPLDGAIAVRLSALLLFAREDGWLDASLDGHWLWADLAWRLRLYDGVVAALPSVYAWKIDVPKARSRTITVEKWLQARRAFVYLSKKLETPWNRLRLSFFRIPMKLTFFFASLFFPGRAWRLGRVRGEERAYAALERRKLKPLIQSHGEAMYRWMK